MCCAYLVRICRPLLFEGRETGVLAFMIRSHYPHFQRSDADRWLFRHKWWQEAKVPFALAVLKKNTKFPTPSSTVAKPCPRPKSVRSTRELRHRVVLDEAHEIRNSNTQLFKACSQVSAAVRWCLTGTPIVNGFKDLYSFIALLRVEPFHQRDWWMRMIERPAKAANAQGIKRLRFILESILLRRTKHLKTKELLKQHVGFRDWHEDPNSHHQVSVRHISNTSGAEPSLSKLFRAKDPSGHERSIVELPETGAFGLEHDLCVSVLL